MYKKNYLREAHIYIVNITNTISKKIMTLSNIFQYNAYFS